jgi:ATP adenylyltransferase
MKIEDLEQQIQEGCRFCNPPEKERILYEGKNFYVMLSLGPIIEGYLLLISKKHLGCCAEIPADITEEFDFLYNRIAKIQQEVYGNSVAYEHGRTGSCMVLIEGSKHCYHAHMHFLPSPIDMNFVVSKDFDNIPLKSLEMFRSSYKNKSEAYLYIDDGIKSMYVIDTQIRRQYLRYKAAILVDKIDLWNWVNIQGWEHIKAAKVKYNKYFDDINV